MGNHQKTGETVIKEFVITSQVAVTATLDQISRLVRAGLDNGLRAAVVTLSRESRSQAQNRKFHAMINDIMKTVELPTKHSFDTWKALLIDAFEQDLKSQGLSLPKPSFVVPSLDGSRVVSIRPSSTTFSKSHCAMFIEFLYWFGQEHGAKFSDESLAYYDEVARARVSASV